MLHIKRYYTLVLGVIALLSAPLAAIASKRMILPHWPLDGKVNDIAVDSAGRASIVGDFLPSRILRLNSDRSIDRDFHSQMTVGGSDGEILAVATLSDDAMLIGGNFGRYDDTVVRNLVKILPNGAVDFDFLAQIGQSFQGPITNILVSANDEILVTSRREATSHLEEATDCVVIHPTGELLATCPAHAAISLSSDRSRFLLSIATDEVGGPTDIDDPQTTHLFELLGDSYDQQ